MYQRGKFQVVVYSVIFTNKAQQDAKKLQERQKTKVKKLIEIMKINPFQSPPSFEKLRHDLEGKFSRRIDIHNRLVYEVLTEEKIIKILRMWTHYE